MARRPKTQARRNGGRGFPGWAWLLVGAVLGGIVFAGVSMRERWSTPTTVLPQPNPDARPPVASDDGAPAPAERPKPKFEFYTLLPEKEVVIPDAELEARAQAEAARRANAGMAAPAPSAAPAAPSATTAPSAASGERYLIQAGAFRGNADAEALKARIALTGEVARIETADINGVTVYRVRMGPYPDARALATAKQALAAHGISGAQAIRVK